MTRPSTQGQACGTAVSDSGQYTLDPGLIDAIGHVVRDALNEARPPALIDADEAARQLGLFGGDGQPLKSWVLAEARAGRIPHVRLGRYVRFDPVALRAWAAARARGPRR